MILESVFDLWVKFSGSELILIWLFPLLALGFIATVPVIIRRFFLWR